MFFSFGRMRAEAIEVGGRDQTIPGPKVSIPGSLDARKNLLGLSTPAGCPDQTCTLAGVWGT